MGVHRTQGLEEAVGCRYDSVLQPVDAQNWEVKTEQGSGQGRLACPVPTNPKTVPLASVSSVVGLLTLLSEA